MIAPIDVCLQFAIFFIRTLAVMCWRNYLVKSSTTLLTRSTFSSQIYAIVAHPDPLAKARNKRREGKLEGERERKKG